jgi:uncharacterized membrane protein
MNHRFILLVSLIFGFLAFGIIFCIYVYGGGFKYGLSGNNADWGAFGNYFGGLLGSIFGFFSFVLLFVTVLQQEKQLEKVFDESLKQNHLKYMEVTNEDIRYLLQRKLSCKNGTYIEFGDLVLGSESNEVSDQKIFKVLLSRLLKYVAEYSNALHLYRDNFDQYFQFRAHNERVMALTDFIKSHETDLEEMEQVTLGLIFKTLSDENSSNA